MAVKLSPYICNTEAFMKSSYIFNTELIRKINPSMSYKGEDLSKWQKNARQKLIELIGLDRFEKTDLNIDIEYEKKTDEMTEIRFTFQSEEGYRVPCHILIPKTIKKPPVMICLQGHSTGMHISLRIPKYPGDEETITAGDRDFCVRAVKEGFAAIALEQRNFGECAANPGEILCTYSKLIASLFGRTTIGERVWDVMRLIDVLEAEFSDKIDLEKIGIMGNSGGGTAAIYTAALEDRIKLTMPSCAVCTYKDSIGAMPHCACNFVPHIAEYFDMDDLIAMSYPKYYIQVNGEKDEIFPIEPAKEVFEKGKNVYKKMGLEDRCVHVIGNGGHRFYADISWPYVHKFID